MAQKKAHEVDAWLARPDRTSAIVLIYGPDRGLVSERASLFVKNTGLSPDDPFAVVRLQGDDVDRDPGRLADEMRTIPMFSDRRLVWLQAGSLGKGGVDAIKALAEDLPGHATLLIEAGDLKKGAPLRTLIENTAAAMALPNYADEGKALDQILDQALEAAGLTITMEARQALKRNLGGDRLASRSEIEKLLLYAQGDGRVTLDHIERLSGDASGPSLDAVIDAVLLGKSEDFDVAFSKVLSTNQIVPLVNGMVRQLQSLETMRFQVEHGKAIAAVIASARPPIFFARKTVIERSLSRWTRPMIVRALERLHQTVLVSRERSALASQLIRQALLALTIESARQER